MTEPSVVILFDDARASGWQPFSLTRPVGELIFGAMSLRDRAARVFGIPCVGHVASRLEGFDEHDAAPVIPLASIDRGAGRLFLSSRAVPAWDAVLPDSKTSCILSIGDDVVGWFAAPGSASPDEGFFRDPIENAPAHLPRCALPGRVLGEVWDLVDAADQIARDILSGNGVPAARQLHDEVVVIGPRDDLRLGRNVTIEPNVVIDTSTGPVWLDNDVTVRAFTRLAGPAVIGAGSTLLGGSIAAVSAGPHCKLRGEIEATTINGYVNKAHDGFIGHSVIGRWVNLGALTTSSDLKNNYGSVRIWTPLGERDTGSTKIGCFLGDHVRTAIGTMLNTGTVIGAGASIFGTTMPTKVVSAFAWGDTGEIHDIDRFLQTARTVMARRGVRLSAGMESVLRSARQSVG